MIQKCAGWGVVEERSVGSSDKELPQCNNNVESESGETGECEKGEKRNEIKIKRNSLVYHKEVLKMTWLGCEVREVGHICFCKKERH